MIKLISWNVNGRTGSALERQADALRDEGPHLVCLQEITAGSEPDWRDRLDASALPHIFCSTGLIGPGRRYANLIASRWLLAALPAGEFEIPYPEKVLSAVVAAPTTAIELHNAHLPPGVSRPVQKLETFEGIFARLARPALRPRILCGDFNTPQAEREDGTIETWASNHRELAERWEQAEGSVLRDLRDHDLADAYRTLKGYDQHPTSYLPHGSTPKRRRYDHIYASESAQSARCGYLEAWREDGLSDHAPVWVELEHPHEPPPPS